MTTILSCTDGSVYAPSVYDHTAWAARRMSARVRVLHMLDTHRDTASTSDFSGAIGLDAQKVLADELVALDEARGRVAQTRGRAILAAAKQHFDAAGISDVQTEHKHGSLIDAIEEHAADVDLVVIGKRGEAADFAKLHLGANLERVIRGCRHPVLVTSRAFKPIQRFILAYDGSPSVLKALDFIVENPLLRGLECHILRAGKIDDTARHYLGEAADRLRAAGFEVTSTAITGPAEEVLAQTVKEQQIDLLVMGAYGHSRIRQFIVGSTTTAMVRTCLVPVMRLSRRAVVAAGAAAAACSVRRRAHCTGRTLHPRSCWRWRRAVGRGFIPLAVYAPRSIFRAMDLVSIYQCLCDHTRLRILHALTGGPLCVCHLQEILGEPQVKVSKHLAYLKQHGMVE